MLLFSLSLAMVAVREGRILKSVVHTVDPTSFRQVPGSPFAKGGVYSPYYATSITPT